MVYFGSREDIAEGCCRNGNEP